MSGGGFLRQMIETEKQNRAMLGKEKRKPFGKPAYKESVRNVLLTDEKKMTEEERGQMLCQIASAARKQWNKNLRILVGSTCLTFLLFYLLFTASGFAFTAITR